jgi:hypothetical protein
MMVLDWVPKAPHRIGVRNAWEPSPDSFLVPASMMPLMFFNTLAAWYLFSLNAPRLFTEAWMKALESQREQSGHNRRA